ncbi:MAG: Sodium/hydrogen exchanger [Parcubacteria group bacterium GW2011_GWF2_40_10]|nr:MAG: Sodium/hydrogen exchanger [Parcubacteria group bacterium GW2011_GWF2_40_10]
MEISIEVFLSIFILLLISTGVFFVSKKLKIPYTVLLVFTGVLMVPLVKLDMLSFIGSFKLTPEMLFFVFLPTLLFESAYNMNFRQINKNVRAISVLAIFSLLISTFFIGFVLSFVSGFIGFKVPFEVALLFGALISATDPVAVLALFKEYGVPKRLAFIFEGESMFNDGTSLAVFLLLLEVIMVGYKGSFTIIGGLFTFSTMVVGGIAIGIFMGGIFSKFLEMAKSNEQIQITLTMVMAHLTFIMTEFISNEIFVFGYAVKFSPVIATTFAALIIGNYGRYKISPTVEEYMEKFWSFFAFVVNSIVFLLMGLIFSGLPIELQVFAPSIILLVIVIVMIGRAVSIYPVVWFLNLLKKEKHIPASWQHLMVWGSLRGALAVTMVFLIPDNLSLSTWNYTFSIRDFLMAITISCIYFTIFIKAPLMKPFIRRFKLDSLSEVECAEYRDSRKFVYETALAELDDFYKKGYINEDSHKRLEKTYKCKCMEKSGDTCPVNAAEDFCGKTLNIYALGTAKHVLRNLFKYGEISDKVYKQVRVGIDVILDKIYDGKDFEIKVDKISHTDWLDHLAAFVRKIMFMNDKERNIKNSFMKYRAISIISNKVSREFAKHGFHRCIDKFYNASEVGKIINFYKKLGAEAEKEMEKFFANNKNVLMSLKESFVEKSLLKAEEGMINSLRSKGMITDKIQEILSKEIGSRLARVSRFH